LSEVDRGEDESPPKAATFPPSGVYREMYVVQKRRRNV